MEDLGQAPQDSVLKQLQQLPGIEIKSTSPTEYVITITEKAAWNQSLTKLAAFWPMIKEAYQAPDEEKEAQLGIAFHNVNKVFVLTDNSGVLGFCSIEYHKSDERVGIIREIIVHPDKRGKQAGNGQKLYEKIFEEPNFDAIISSSNTLPAVINRFRTSGSRGFTTYWGNMGSGNPEVERLRQLDTEYLASEGVLVDETLPPGNEGFSLTSVAPIYILPISADAVARAKQDLPPDDPILIQAQHMFELQKSYLNDEGELRAVVAGHLISIRNNETH